MLEPTVTLKFDILTQEIDPFIFVQKCTNAESLVKNVQHFSRYCVNNVRDAQTERLNEQPENIEPPATLFGEGIKMVSGHGCVFRRSELFDLCMKWLTPLMKYRKR